MLRVHTLVGVLLISGCSIFSSSDNRELDDARARWTRASISDYNYSLLVGCFCGEGGSYDIEVRDGEITSIVRTNNAGGMGGDGYVGETVDELFGVLAQAYAQNADDVQVTYDAALGFPATISIDYILEAVDDEIFYGVDNFESLN